MPAAAEREKGVQFLNLFFETLPEIVRANNGAKVILSNYVNEKVFVCAGNASDNPTGAVRVFPARVLQVYACLMNWSEVKQVFIYNLDKQKAPRYSPMRNIGAAHIFYH